VLKLAILGGGGVRMPAFVRAVISRQDNVFDEINLFEPDRARRETTCRLAVEVAAALGHPGVVTVTADLEQSFTGADFVFSAIRVGGDLGRAVDEDVALRHGLVGQETTGAGGAAMALRTIPVVLSYCQALARLAPRAVLINFTNPAGIITQAIASYGGVRTVGVCDTPSGTVERLGEFLGASEEALSFDYSGLHHLGWISSVSVEGVERIGDVLDRFEELQRFDHRFAALDADMVRRVGAVPTEYVFYYYDPDRYVDRVKRAGTSRGQDVLRLN
jgi:6-phospho-beta-glucosidase